MKHINLSFSSIVKPVIQEDIVDTKKKYGFDVSGKIDKAIDTMHYIYLNYDDRKGDKYTRRNPDGSPMWGNPRNYRIVLPFCHYRSSQNGEDTLRALHWNDRHTKRGPGKWKEFKLSGMKNVRILKSTFTKDDVPEDANWDGDSHASEIYNIVGRNSGEIEKKFISPLEREMARVEREKKGLSSDNLYTNQQGPVTQKQNIPQVKKGRNLKTMRNLGKPGNIDYKKAYDAFKQSDSTNTFRDWDAAEAEKRDQDSMRNRPITPPTNNSGPVQGANNDEIEGYEEYMNNHNNKF